MATHSSKNICFLRDTTYNHSDPHIQAIDEQMGSVRFFLPTKTIHQEIENEMHGFHILQLGKPGIHTLCAR